VTRARKEGRRPVRLSASQVAPLLRAQDTRVAHAIALERSLRASGTYCG
jgi:hypothetical protein